jgi:hypothetical protein
MDETNTPTHDECARLAKQHWEEETNPKRKEFLGKMAQMWAELAAVKKLETQLNEAAEVAMPADESERLVG